MLSVAPSRKAHTSSAAPSPTFTLSAALAPGLALVLRQACTGGGGGSGEGMEQAMQRRVAHGCMQRPAASGGAALQAAGASQPASQASGSVPSLVPVSSLIQTVQDSRGSPLLRGSNEGRHPPATGAA